MNLALYREADSGKSPPLYISCSTIQSEQEGEYDGSTMYTTLTFHRRISRGIYNPFVSAFQTSSGKDVSAGIIPDTSVSISPFEHCQEFTAPYRNETWRFAEFKPIPCKKIEIQEDVTTEEEESDNDIIAGLSWDCDVTEGYASKYKNVLYAIDDVIGIEKRVPMPVMRYDDTSMACYQELHQEADVRKSHKKQTSIERRNSKKGLVGGIKKDATSVEGCNRVQKGVGKGNNRQNTHNFHHSIVKQLKDLFNSDPNPSKDQIDTLVSTSGLSHRQVYSWFSRSRYRRFL
jgi:hypothetical protein